MSHIFSIDGISFELQEYQDLGWLRNLGRVFTVFDQQDSGNICFGVENESSKIFVKYAGAKPIDYNGDPEDAILRLRQAVIPYRELDHPSLTRLIDTCETPAGFAAVFEWFDGECLHPHWAFAGPAKHTDPRSPYYRFRQLPISKRLDALSTIFEFHVHVESKGFVAIDFYDGSILYNFTTNEVKICDIDFYAKRPFLNTMGRLWGSSRFMSPEEFELGALIDERTNVFNMGAIAFGLLGRETDYSLSLWEASQPLYEIAFRAVNKNREKRYESVAVFASAWEKARREEI